MSYIAWIDDDGPVIPDDCEVIWLTHCEEAPPANEAPYAIADVTSGGNEFTTTTNARFGTYALTHGAANANYVLIQSPDAPFNGDATFEYWIRRSTGWQSNFTGDAALFRVYFSTGGINDCTVDLNVSASGFVGFSIAYNGLGAAGTVAATWSDSDYHAIAICLDRSAETAKVFVDGDLMGSMPYSPTLGATVETALIALHKQVTDDDISFDEARLTLNMVRYRSGYTPATGPWVDATCGSGTE